MVTAICLCTSYDPLLGCAISWESCHAYFLYIIWHSIVVILVDHHSQKWIRTLLFELFFTWIKKNIFVPTFSISHLCFSIIKLFCCFLTFGHIFTWNIQPYTTLIQHGVPAQVTVLSLISGLCLWWQQPVHCSRHNAPDAPPDEAHFPQVTSLPDPREVRCNEDPLNWLEGAYSRNLHKDPWLRALPSPLIQALQLVNFQATLSPFLFKDVKIATISGTWR